MSQITPKLILAFGVVIIFLILFLNLGIEAFILASALVLGATLLGVSLLSSFYVLIFIRPSLDIFGQYSIVFSSQLPSINVAGFVAIISILVSLFILWQSKTRILVIPLSIPFILLLFVYFIFSITSSYPGTSINELVRVFSFLIMYFTGYVVINSKKDLIYFVKILISSSVIPAIVAYIQLFNGAGLYTNPGFENRIAGTFGHPNVLGYFLLIILSLIVYVYFENIIIQPLYKQLLVLYGVLLSVLLIATYTRGAWIGLAILLAGICLIKFTKKTLIYSSILVPAMIILIFNYIWLEKNVFYDLPALEKIPVIARVVGLFNGDPSDSIIWRRVMWADMYNKGLSSPIIGFGTGTIELMAEEVRGVSLGALEAHNDYIKVFVETGIVGLSVYILFIFALIYSLFIRIKSRDDSLFLITTFIVIVIYLSSLWDNLLRQTAVMWIFFAFLGVVFKYHTIRVKDSQSVDATEE